MENLKPKLGDLKFCLLHMTNVHDYEECHTLKPLKNRLPTYSQSEIVRKFLYLRGSRDWETRVIRAPTNQRAISNPTKPQHSLGEVWKRKLIYGLLGNSVVVVAQLQLPQRRVWNLRKPAGWIWRTRLLQFRMHQHLYIFKEVY